MQVCTLLQTDNQASTPPLSFYRLDALPAAQPNSAKALKAPLNDYYNSLLSLSELNFEKPSVLDQVQWPVV